MRALIMAGLSLYFTFFSVAAAPKKLVRHANHYQRAVALILPLEGQRVTGSFSFVQQPDGVLVQVVLSGLTPNQDHGVHIHEYGDISDQVDGKTAGGHYNPDGHQHGLPPNPIRHAGSFGNVSANDRGEAMWSLWIPPLPLLALKTRIGRTVVVHARKDTGEQPAGNAGSRIGMGVIGVKPAVAY